MEWIAERRKAALLGAVLGDALGVPYEFEVRSGMARKPATGMTGYGTHNQPPGTWSDDSSMMLCTAESLIGGYDPEDIARRFLRWFDEGYMTPHGETFDFGGITAEAMRALRRGVPALEAGGAGEMDNGNGSLMRILPVALLYAALPPEELLRRASAVSSITHAHPRSRLACGIYCLLAADLLTAGPKPSAGLLTRLKDRLPQLTEDIPHLTDDAGLLTELPHFHRIFEADFPRLPESEIRSDGYVVHTLEAALWCVLRSGSYEAAVLDAVNLGFDTDTTACVAGGLAGLVHGIAGLPPAWLAALKEAERVMDIAEGVAIYHVRG